jgi:anti-anti-sigma factor
LEKPNIGILFSAYLSAQVYNELVTLSLNEAKSMILEQVIRDDIVILRPKGRVDSTNSGEIERVALELLEAGNKRFIYDLSDMDYISSAGLRVILLTGKKLRACDGKMVLVGMHDLVKDVFEMSGFLTLFAAAKTLDDGLTKI